MNLSSIIDISNVISLKECPFYKNENFRPIVDAFLQNKEGTNYRGKEFELMGRYEFGISAEHRYDKDHFYLFIGYRYLTKNETNKHLFYPFFISMEKRLNEDKQEYYSIDGFLTLEEEHCKHPYFSDYKKLEGFKNWQGVQYELYDQELVDHFKKIASATKRKLKKTQKAAQANWKSRRIQDPYSESSNLSAATRFKKGNLKND